MGWFSQQLIFAGINFSDNNITQKNHRKPIADVLQNEYSEKFRKIHRKTPVPQGFFKKQSCVPPLRATLLQRDSGTDVFVCILQNSEEQLFYRSSLDKDNCF